MEFVLQYIKIKPHGVLSITFDDGDIYEWNTVCTHTLLSTSWNLAGYLSKYQRALHKLFLRGLG